MEIVMAKALFFVGLGWFFVEKFKYNSVVYWKTMFFAKK
tara:strand:+ start:1855 stop:1971 length:117 start_codon:yes stop_codon:yes gene_type:complete